MKAWKKWVNISVVLVGLVVLLGLGVVGSVDDGNEGNVSVTSPLPLEVLERRTEFDERWEQLKSDHGFMEILERERNREFFRLEVAQACVEHNIAPDLYQKCLARNISLDLCENAAEKIAVCAESKPLAECEAAYLDFAEKNALFREEIEKAVSTQLFIV